MDERADGAQFALLLAPRAVRGAQWAASGTVMKRKQLKFGRGFRVALGNDRAQAAEMVIPPGASEGSPDNRHQGADQWLFVVAGSGTARINGRRYPLRAGTLLLIERGDRHEISNSGRSLLRTLNWYLPPAYDSSGDELPPARS